LLQGCGASANDGEFGRPSFSLYAVEFEKAVTLRHPEALQRPVDQAGVATFDLAIDGRE
jgi:NTE family protein